MNEPLIQEQIDTKGRAKAIIHIVFDSILLCKIKNVKLLEAIVII